MPVFPGSLVADLPGSVHFVPEAPEPAVPRLFPTVLRPQVGPVGSALVIDVFDETARLVQPARAEVDRQHHLGPGLFGPVGEFVDADLVGLGRAPGEVEPLRSLLLRPDAVFPVVSGHEVAARIPADRSVQRADEVDHVLAHALGIGGRVAGFIDSGVDRTPKMFQKGPIQPLVDVRDRIGAVRRDPSFHCIPPFGS
jgi:hypothetical protein